MLPATSRVLFRNVSFSKKIHTSVLNLERFEHPLWRTINILKNDLSFKKKPDIDNNPNLIGIFPRYVDILIVGGGALGSSIAYWLKEKTGQAGVKIAVLEKDPTYSKSSAVLSAGGLKQQFSLPENIHLSVFGAEFIRTLKKRFGSEGDVYYTPNGYLTLASEAGGTQLIDNSKLQRELGAINVILSAKELKDRFPWLNVQSVELGCLGLESEGWFDPWAMLCLLRKGAMEAGAQYVTCELDDFIFTKRHDIHVDGVEVGSYEGIDEAIVKLPNGEMKSIQFSLCILACGADTAEIGKLARIGVGDGLLSVPLPIEKRKRYVYSYSCNDERLNLNTPMTIDYSGVYFRRDGLGGNYIAGLSPLPHEETANDDHQYFHDKIKPILAHRVPAFSNVNIKSAWSGFYDYNYYDENGIVGPHPYYHNMYIAAGFSGYGIQQAPGVGRGIAELILDGDYQTIGLNRLGFDRFIVNSPLSETCII